MRTWTTRTIWCTLDCWTMMIQQNEVKDVRSPMRSVKVVLFMNSLHKILERMTSTRECCWVYAIILKQTINDTHQKIHLTSTWKQHKEIEVAFIFMGIGMSGSLRFCEGLSMHLLWSNQVAIIFVYCNMTVDHCRWSKCLFHVIWISLDKPDVISLLSNRKRRWELKCGMDKQSVYSFYYWWFKR